MNPSSALAGCVALGKCLASELAFSGQRSCAGIRVRLCSDEEECPGCAKGRDRQGFMTGLQDPDLLLTALFFCPRPWAAPGPHCDGRQGPSTHSQHRLRALPLTIPMSAGEDWSPGGQFPGHHTEYGQARTSYRDGLHTLVSSVPQDSSLASGSTSPVGSGADGAPLGPTSGVPASGEPSVSCPLTEDGLWRFSNCRSPGFQLSPFPK